MKTITISTKRKVIDIPEDVLHNLSVKAAANGLNLKKYIETLLVKDVEDMDDSVIYANLCETRPEGKILLSPGEKKEFEKWLGLNEK